MKYRYIFILIMTLVASSCANEIEPEDALQLFIPNSHNLVTKELSNKNIPYRVDEKGIIWYPSKYKKKSDILTQK